MRSHQLRDGDLLFVRRPGVVQWLVDWSGGRWRHVGIVVSLHGHWWMLEAGRDGYRARPVSTILARYQSVAVSRLQDCPRDCPNRLVGAALDLMEQPTSYPGTLELALAGLLSLTRRSATVHDSRLGALAQSIVRHGQARIERQGERTLCASLVVRSLARICGGHARFTDLAEPIQRPIGRHRDPMADRLSLPDDVWRLFGADDRYRLDRNDASSRRPAPDPPLLLRPCCGDRSTLR